MNVSYADVLGRLWASAAGAPHQEGPVSRGSGRCLRPAPHLHQLLERGKNRPSLDTIFDLADALDTRPSELLRRVEKVVGR